MRIQGWAPIAPEKGTAGDEVLVTPAGDDGGFRVDEAQVTAPPDGYPKVKPQERYRRGIDFLEIVRKNQIPTSRIINQET